MLVKIVLLLLIIEKCGSTTSPIKPLSDLKYSVELEKNVADLWWSIDEEKKEIIFELHVHTTGWISLGISPAGGMKGADIGVGWVDQKGSVYFQDRYALNFTRPIIDNTTKDWIPLKGKEANGWTAIQFKRLLDTCDSMDYPINSGTNILIYAYGLVDPVNYEITYHDTRRGTKMVPLLSYGQPPLEAKFAGLDYFDLRLDNYVVPSTDTTYHCKVYKAPTQYTTKRHAIAYKVLIDEENVDLVHHLLLHECNPTSVFDDNNLPDGVCDVIFREIEDCSTSIATGWAVGGDRMIEFVEEAGYPVGSRSPNKYFMVQMHYDNPKKTPGRRDNSGIRFFLSNQLRVNDLGYLTFGTVSSVLGLAIPPKMDRFVVDSYCPSLSTQSIPENGIIAFAAFPHTHLQGFSMWTKLIRNKTAVQYLFNAEAYDFNYQFENRLPKPIHLYPGDEFATRCIYSTANKDEITTGGERTKDEMCLHFFTYYPRMDKFSTCYTMMEPQALQNQINPSANFSYLETREALINRTWTPESSKQWQDFYNNGQHVGIHSGGGIYDRTFVGDLPKYKDLETPICERRDIANNDTVIHNGTFIIRGNAGNTTITNNGILIYQSTFMILLFFIILIIV